MLRVGDWIRDASLSSVSLFLHRHITRYVPFREDGSEFGSLEGVDPLYLPSKGFSFKGSSALRGSCISALYVHVDPVECKVLIYQSIL